MLFVAFTEKSFGLVLCDKSRGKFTTKSYCNVHEINSILKSPGWLICDVFQIDNKINSYCDFSGHGDLLVVSPNVGQLIVAIYYCCDIIWWLIAMLSIKWFRSLECKWQLSNENHKVIHCISRFESFHKTTVSVTSQCSHQKRFIWEQWWSK